MGETSRTPSHSTWIAWARRPTVYSGLVLDIEDISMFVAELRQVVAKENITQLATPLKTVYVVSDNDVARHLELDLSAS